MAGRSGGRKFDTPRTDKTERDQDKLPDVADVRREAVAETFRETTPKLIDGRFKVVRVEDTGSQGPFAMLQDSDTGETAFRYPGDEFQGGSFSRIIEGQGVEIIPPQGEGSAYIVPLQELKSKPQERLFDYEDLREQAVDGQYDDAYALLPPWIKDMIQAGEMQYLGNGMTATNIDEDIGPLSPPEPETDPEPMELPPVWGESEGYQMEHIYGTDNPELARDMADYDFYQRTEGDPAGSGTIESGYHDDYDGTGLELHHIKGEDMTRYFLRDPSTGAVTNVTGLIGAPE